MPKKSMKHHAASHADAKWVIVFWWNCNRQYFEKDHNSRIE
jgi:hypothetical protein